jgi:hypothetical protein
MSLTAGINPYLVNANGEHQLLVIADLDVVSLLTLPVRYKFLLFGDWVIFLWGVWLPDSMLLCVMTPFYVS